MSIPEASRILLLGPPAAGKSTLVHQLNTIRGIRLPPYNFDDCVLKLARRRQHEGPLPDDLIDAAVRGFLRRIPRDMPCVVELPHHDYVKLITNGSLDLESFDVVAVVVAPLSALVERSAHRAMVVPIPYIARCVGSTAALCEFLPILGGFPWLAIDSSLLSPTQQAALLVDFLRRGHSASLGRLSVAPVPQRPDLGGHLHNAMEWDEGFVRWLVDCFTVRTALDIGCGAGLSVDAFAALGVACWGIDGNPRLLSGPCRIRERLLVVDFTRQWVEWPMQPDLVWCVEVIEHIPEPYEENVLRTISHNTGRVAFVTAAPPGQIGYHHVNCKPRDYWINRMTELGLAYFPDAEEVLMRLDDRGPFGRSFLKHNGMVFTRNR